MIARVRFDLSYFFCINLENTRFFSVFYSFFLARINMILVPSGVLSQERKGVK